MKLSSRIFAASLAFMAVLCSLVLVASAASPPAKSQEQMFDSTFLKQSAPKPAVSKAAKVATPSIVQCDEMVAPDSGSEPFETSSPNISQKALLTIPFDSNVSKNYTVVYNLRQYPPFAIRKLLIKSRAVPVDYIPLPSNEPGDDQAPNNRFPALNFGFA